MEEVTQAQALKDSPEALEDLPDALGDSPPGQRLYSYLCCLMPASLTRCMCEMLASYAVPKKKPVFLSGHLSDSSTNRFRGRPICFK